MFGEPGWHRDRRRGGVDWAVDGSPSPEEQCEESLAVTPGVMAALAAAGALDRPP